MAAASGLFRLEWLMNRRDTRRTLATRPATAQALGFPARRVKHRPAQEREPWDIAPSAVTEEIGPTQAAPGLSGDAKAG